MINFNINFILRVRYVEEAKELTTKVEALMEEIKLKTSEIFDLKKQMLESDTQFKQQQNLFDVIRTERNACAKELIEAQVWYKINTYSLLYLILVCSIKYIVLYYL